jgi:hypothetical protein
VDLLEHVRVCLLNARLTGSFYLRREGSAVRLDLRRKESAAAILDALRGGNFGIAKTDERGVLMISAPAKDGA